MKNKTYPYASFNCVWEIDGVTAASTSTFPLGYKDWFIEDILKFVRDAIDEKDATANLKVLMEKYEKEKSLKDKLFYKKYLQQRLFEEKK